MSSSFFEALNDNNFETENIEIQYKIYYDKNNKPLFFSTEDIPGDYVIITKEEYESFRLDRVIIKEGKAVEEFEQPKYIHPFARQPVEWIK